MCEDLFLPDNITVTGIAEEYKPGNVVTFHCDKGLVLKGNDTLMCLESGQWSHDQPYCSGKPSLTSGN